MSIPLDKKQRQALRIMRAGIITVLDALDEMIVPRELITALEKGNEGLVIMLRAIGEALEE